MGQERVIQERSSLSGHDPAFEGFYFLLLYSAVPYIASLI